MGKQIQADTDRDIQLGNIADNFEIIVQACLILLTSWAYIKRRWIP